MSVSHGVQLHVGRGEGGTECKEGIVGDATLTIIWYCYRDGLISRRLKGYWGFTDMPVLDTDLKKWLTTKCEGTNSSFNNFIRVGSACLEEIEDIRTTVQQLRTH
jgi:hypothetical protein